MSRFLALDFETGGLDPNRHAPVQLGIALFDGGEPVETFETLVGPTLHWKTGKIEREYDCAALAVSQTAWDDVLRAPKPSEVVAELRGWAERHGLARTPVVAFNAAFDLSFYRTLLWLASDWHPTVRGQKTVPVPPLCGPWSCAWFAALAALPGLPDHKLDTVAGHFGHSRKGEAHGALEDAVLAGRVWLALEEGQ